MSHSIPLAFIAGNALLSMAQQSGQARTASRQAEYQNAALELDAQRRRNEAQAGDAGDVQAAATAQRQSAFESDERRRRLARAQATQRASFAGRGVSQEGSGAALLRSLLDEHDRTEAEAGLTLNDRLAAIRRGMDLRRRQLALSEQSSAQQRQLNLLQASAARRNARLGMARTALSAASGIYDRWPAETPPTETIPYDPSWAR